MEKKKESHKSPCCCCSALAGVLVIVFAWWNVSWAPIALTVLGVAVIVKELTGCICKRDVCKKLDKTNPESDNQT
ncbi:MAG TPA: hypothetical protein PK997_07020 [Candidatus Omnitrophota bacterium]|jgi:hypothetical protein|nr:MAG: hypothetical protein BWY49_00963 [Candidatus Omnitrophica bacterium ADurb.Bin314]HOE68323.1 hypothetical protein [Candidatus Omnitrophota bacterium]HPW64688.1 hypothetical protein [Candidatus Omnitrophota bacterium]HQB94942.1 hypothetical protein [Candidatus Omnitrophota bacterium]